MLDCNHSKFEYLVCCNTIQTLFETEKNISEWHDEIRNSSAYQHLDSDQTAKLDVFLGKLAWCAYDLQEYYDRQNKMLHEHATAYRCLMGLMSTITNELSLLKARCTKSEELDINDFFAATLLLIELIQRAYDVNQDNVE